MFFVYHGYVGPDNYDARNGPFFKLTKCNNEAEVLALLKKHDEELGSGPSHQRFRVIEGVAREIKAVSTVTKYKLA